MLEWPHPKVRCVSKATSQPLHVCAETSRSVSVSAHLFSLFFLHQQITEKFLICKNVLSNKNDSDSCLEVLICWRWSAVYLWCCSGAFGAERWQGPNWGDWSQRTVRTDGTSWTPWNRGSRTSGASRQCRIPGTARRSWKTRWDCLIGEILDHLNSLVEVIKSHQSVCSFRGERCSRWNQNLSRRSRTERRERFIRKPRSWRWDGSIYCRFMCCPFVWLWLLTFTNDHTEGMQLSVCLHLLTVHLCWSQVLQALQVNQELLV